MQTVCFGMIAQSVSGFHVEGRSRSEPSFELAATL